MGLEQGCLSFLFWKQGNVIIGSWLFQSAPIQRFTLKSTLCSFYNEVTFLKIDTQENG